MQTTWLVNKPDNTKLLIIALGWGASPEVLGNQIMPENYDIITIYDYKKLNYDALWTKKYQTVSLIAWSFGVWASEQLFPNMKFTEAVAITGTPHPIDRNFGIDPRVFNLTVQSIQSNAIVEFVVRMCGRQLRTYNQHHSKRTTTDIQEEIQILNIEGQKPYAPKIRWTEFIAAGKDKIFPAKSVESYAKQNGVNCRVIEDAPHYVFYDENLIKCTIKA